MRASLAAALTVIILLTFPAAAPIFWPNSDGDHSEGYQLYQATCRNAPQPPASCTAANGIFAGFITLQNSKVPDEAAATAVAKDYIAAHPWPAVADGFDLRFRLEEHDGLLWNGTIYAPKDREAHALIDGELVPPVKSRPVGHIWVKPDGTAFYPVGYK